jgi:hypothetical protein
VRREPVSRPTQERTIAIIPIGEARTDVLYGVLPTVEARFPGCAEEGDG